MGFKPFWVFYVGIFHHTIARPCYLSSSVSFDFYNATCSVYAAHPCRKRSAGA